MTVIVIYAVGFVHIASLFLHNLALAVKSLENTGQQHRELQFGPQPELEVLATPKLLTVSMK